MCPRHEIDFSWRVPVHVELTWFVEAESLGKPASIDAEDRAMLFKKKNGSI
jgi:hypothetical protein